MPIPSSDLTTRHAALGAAVAAEKAAIRQARARLRGAKSEVLELEAQCRRLGIGFRTEPSCHEGGS